MKKNVLFDYQIQKDVITNFKGMKMEKGRLILLVAASACMGSMIATAQTTKVTGKVISLEDIRLSLGLQSW